MEENKTFFSFPATQEALVALIRTVPQRWSWVNGRLDAPTELIASSQAVKGTGLRLERYSDIHPLYEGELNDGRRAEPDILAMVVERRLPGHVNFQEAGYHCTLMPFQLCKDIALAYIERGYTGCIEFVLGQSEERIDHMAVFRICWKSCNGPHLAVSYDNQYDGPKTQAAEIIAKCRELGLAELKP
jgi:hypothetical protein